MALVTKMKLLSDMTGSGIEPGYQGKDPRMLTSVGQLW